MTCPSCDTANPAGSRFCNGCGTSLAAAATSTREERKTVTVLFCDLAGFTARSDGADPEDVRALVRPFHALLRREIEAYGGTLARIVGDAGMAVFGYPAAHEDDPERAVRAGLAVLDGLERLNRELPGLDLHARIGIDTAEAVVTYGSTLEDADDLMGDGINAASRLQAAAPVDGLVVGEAAHRATAHLFAYEPLAPVEAKGKTVPLPLWRARQALARPAGRLLVETTPLVGRDLELASLVRLFERARATPAFEIVTIVADPGLGKSRLVRELAHHLDARPELVTWRAGRCLPYGEGIGFWALGEIVKAHAGILDTDDQVTLSAKLDAVLTEPDRSLRAWMKDRLGPLVGLEVSTQPPRQEEAFTAWRRFLESVAAAGPLVLVVEDLHWADDALIAFLGHLAERTAGLPILLVTTARPEVEDRHPGWLARARRHTVFSLAALDDAEMAALLRATLPGADGSMVAAILERAGGSPLYAEQLAAMLRDRPGPGASADAVVPPTIAALLAARIDALPADAKAVLLDASVIGRTFWSGAVATLADRDPADVEDVLAELARRELVRPAHPSTMAGEREFSFVHALVRDVAYGELARADRLARHRAAAGWITERAGAALGEDAEIVVAHLEHALEIATVAGHRAERPAIEADLAVALLTAGATATRTDVPRAITHLRRALELLPAQDPRRADVLGRIGVLLAAIEEYDAAVESLDAARASHVAAGDDLAAARLALPIHKTCIRIGQVEAADRVFAEAEPIMRARGGAELVDHLAAKAQIEWSRSRAAEAWALVEESLALAERLGLPPPYRALLARGLLRLDDGDRDGEHDVREAVRHAEAAGDLSAVLVALDNLGSILSTYSIPDAFATHEQELALARSRGLPATLAESNFFLLSFAAGHWDEALAGLHRAEESSRRQDDAFMHLFIVTTLANIELHRGDLHRDPVAMAEAARQFGRPYALMSVFPMAALLANAGGRHDLAASLLADLAATLAAGSLLESDSVQAAVEAGRLDLADRLLANASPAIQRQGLAEATVLEARGDLEAASSRYRTAVGWAHDVGVVPEEARALAGLGRCLLARGETWEGVGRLREAREMWAGMKATPRIAEIDALLAHAGAAADSTPVDGPA